MTIRRPYQKYALFHRARNTGLAVAAAAIIGGYVLLQHSPVTADVAIVPTSTVVSAAPGVASTSTVTATATPSTGLYTDGQYNGTSYSAEHFGDVQVEAIITDGKLADFKILDYPRDRSTSRRISQIAIPYLMQEAIQAQSADIDLISGATFTSEAFIASLNSALDAASSAVPTATPTATGSAGTSL